MPTVHRCPASLNRQLPPGHEILLSEKHQLYEPYLAVDHTYSQENSQEEISSKSKLKGANWQFVFSFDLAPTSPWPRNITLRETPTLRVILLVEALSSTSYLTSDLAYPEENSSEEISSKSKLKGAKRTSVSSFNFRPAVNRQPMFPRDMTRRANSACPPTKPHNEFLRLFQRTRSKNKRKIRCEVSSADKRS